ncbi:hypothetical protein GF374_02485 [Candidatus Woesearchaeota archaeon]|nr:hypothetical protein [Candidatus Woesearchaeota archaeon]
MLRFHKRGKEKVTADIASTIILATILAMIVFYVLTVPGAQEEFNITEKKVLLDTKPGLIGEAEEKVSAQEEFTLDNIIIDNSPRQQKSIIFSTAFTKKTLFTEKTASFSFDIINKSALAWINIEANIIEKKGEGNLVFILNGQQIYSKENALNSDITVPLPSNILVEGKNNVTIETSPVGWNFWITNSYKLANVNLVKGTYDSPKASLSQLVTLSSDDLSDAEDAELTAYVKQLSEQPQEIKLRVNEELVFEGVPPSSFDIGVPLSALKTGTNKIEWEVDRDGIYQIAFGELTISTTTVEDGETKEYDFTILSDDWPGIDIGTSTCELYVKQSADKSKGNEITINLNEEVIIYNFVNEKIELDVCEYLVEGKNSISLSASDDVYVERLRVTIS